MALSPVITTQQTAFLRFELDHGDTRRKKKALQDVCRMYRNGARFNAENLEAVETTIDGLLLQSNQDRKVVRWSLNALGQLGRRTKSDNPVRLALKHYDGDPEITAAGIAALSSMHGGRIDEIDLFQNCDPCLRTLAALQNTDPKLLDLSAVRIDIDKADKEILKLALITVGLNRDVDNLFHPKHSNGQIIKALGTYPDDIVVQYSVWAIIENQKLGMHDLGVSTHQVDALPANVQAKIMQLVAMRESDHDKRHALMLDGPYLPNADAREGMAKGLLSVYYEGLEGIMLDWSKQESVEYVRKLLAEHFARFSNSCVMYEEEALKLFDANPELRDHLRLGAEGRPLYKKLLLQDLRMGTADLFGEEDDFMQSIKKTKPVRKSVKALMLLAAPKDADRLRLDEEVRDLKDKLRMVQNAVVDVVVVNEWAVRVDQIQDALFNEKPQVLHFSGHGDTGMLFFEDRIGDAAPVDAKSFGELIGLHADTVKCVILSACYSEDVAKIVRAHVPWVIGCDQSIADDAAIAFSRAFYRAVANGEDYQKAFRHARNEVSLNGMSAEADKYKLL
ncbi:CHAT domain-containing protein [Agrobacterium sp. CNPSo 3708]|uniref:CHAT domain-containing protein n=1 Tax=Agrobacterium TaxID=357 RepID=UPI0023649026|nr:CHAT domain-containing protein [Agrobacterium sp. CNPSo 3708]MDD1498803.1 CHAT domain-containing protein [Agrobacterium sp. CNPSo 3708]